MHFLVKNAEKISDKHFGRPLIIQEYLEYLKEEGSHFPFSTLFREMHSEYQSHGYKDQRFNLYTIEVMSYFDIKTIKRKNKYIGPLASEMHYQSRG